MLRSKGPCQSGNQGYSLSVLQTLVYQKTSLLGQDTEEGVGQVAHGSSEVGQLWTEVTRSSEGAYGISSQGPRSAPKQGFLPP